MADILEKICRNYYKARSRRSTAEKYGLDENIIDYKDTGCYRCDGHNIKCSSYFENTPEFITKRRDKEVR